MSINSLNTIGISTKEWFEIIGKMLNSAFNDKHKLNIIKHRHPEAIL